jgi:HAE1 family hydrophobic/amphiphilic exporter-1
VPAGSLKSKSQDITVRATADLATPEDFENLILKNHVRLGDVATVTLGPDDGSTAALERPGGIGLGIIRQAQSNTLDISAGVKTMIGQLQATCLPPGTRTQSRATTPSSSTVRCTRWRSRSWSPSSS